MTTRPSLSIFSPYFTRYLFIAFMLTSSLSHATTEWDIDKLMHSLAQTRSSHAKFVEKKSIAMLDAPVESSGELFYSAPDRLEKRTIKPKPELMILDHDTLVIERGRQKHRLQLQSYPELAVFIDSIRGTLAGDRRALEANYRLDLDGTAENWTLQLLPTNEKMQAMVQRIRIAGVHDTVRSIDITQADGDNSFMLIEKPTSP
jgi:outer membrane lipoprotein-sorting protein